MQFVLIFFLSRNKNLIKEFKNSNHKDENYKIWESKWKVKKLNLYLKKDFPNTEEYWLESK